MSKFSSNINYLRQYVNGELSLTQMYEIERAMHTDEMLMDIIEGLETEKVLKSANPARELQAKIKSRTAKKKEFKIFNIRKLTIAASFIGLLAAGALYFLKPEPHVEVVQTAPEIVPLENKITENLIPDSSQIAYSDNSHSEEISSAAPPTIKREKTASKKETPSPKKIMAYSAKPKLEVIIEGPRYLKKQDEEIIQIAGKSDITAFQTEVLNGRVGSSSQKPMISSSIAKTQADLQRLDLDPQTKANLTTMLARQAQENKVEVKEKQTESTISDVLISGNTLANKASADSRIVSSTETFETIVSKPIQNGNPTIGWSKFNTYIKEQLNKKGLKSYKANISFSLDASLKPTLIEIKSSSDKIINQHIKEILMNGPTWENKDPNHPIFIRINSEEVYK
ncbi:hypothetical protein [Sphingobacterium cavernae]|uniref:hypothetical protein n=1 Tax=Sphingobacterium cavernae TaxID=2592657 RepID=UPI00122FFE00|nr:hypothetical protein [Sphingobacterium cavernae]